MSGVPSGRWASYRHHFLDIAKAGVLIHVAGQTSAMCYLSSGSIGMEAIFLPFHQHCPYDPCQIVGQRTPLSNAVVSLTAASTAPRHFAIWWRSERTAPVTAAAICLPRLLIPSSFVLAARGVLPRNQTKGRGKMACRAIALRVACIGCQLACGDGAYARNGHQSIVVNASGLQSGYLAAINSAR